jgi:uncharacterized phage protein (TIGR01671 family)
MRTMRFRAWDSKNKKFPFGAFHIIGECTAFDLLNQYRLEEYNDLTVQQSTLLNDKNGKEIYEGDIVRLGWNTTDVNWSGMLAVVVWWHNGFYFDVGGGSLAQDTFYQFKYSEVVGNIFENPDLVPNGKLTV